MSGKGMSREMYEFILENLDRIDIDIENGKITTIKGTNGTLCSSTGYLRVKINKRLLQVHQILAVLYFGEDCIGFQINHKDGNKLNNLKYNLEAITQEDNLFHQRANGWGSYSQDKRIRQLDKDGNLIAEYKSEHEASRKTLTSANNIANSIRGYDSSGNKRYTAGGYKWELIE